MTTPRRTWRAALPAALLAASLLAPLAGGAAPRTAQPAFVELDLALGPNGTAVAEVVQTWTGPAARSFRQSLDVYFGAGDGVLTEEEVQRVARTTEGDLRGKPLPWLSSAGANWTIASPLVSFQGASGPIDAPGDVAMRHSLNLTSAQAALPEQLHLDAPWNATLRVSVPEGKVVEGGAPANVTRGERTVLRIADAPPPPAPTPAPTPTTAPPMPASPPVPEADRSTQLPPAVRPDVPEPNATGGLDAQGPGASPGLVQPSGGGADRVVLGVVLAIVGILAVLTGVAAYVATRRAAREDRKRFGT